MGQSGLVIQPSLTASYRDFSVTFWGNLDTNQRDTKTATFNKGLNETATTLSHTYAIQKLSLTGGYINYGRKYADETKELFLTGSYNTLSQKQWFSRWYAQSRPQHSSHQGIYKSAGSTILLPSDIQCQQRIRQGPRERILIKIHTIPMDGER